MLDADPSALFSFCYKLWLLLDLKHTIKKHASVVDAVYASLLKQLKLNASIFWCKKYFGGIAKVEFLTKQV